MLKTGTSIIHYKNDNETPMQLSATQPTKILVTTNQNEFDQIRPIITDSIKAGKLWVIATSYEWGLSQLGLPARHSNTLFLEYDSYSESTLTTPPKKTTQSNQLNYSQTGIKKNLVTLLLMLKKQ